MEIQNILQNALDAIDRNLRGELCVEELARESGFSRWHFSRLFQETVGIPPAQYLTLRRLQFAAYAAKNGRSLTETALEYGFDSYAGFYKAFVREFGCSPSEYLRKHPARRPERFQLEKEEHKMLTHEIAKAALAHWNLENAPLEEYRYPSSGYLCENCLWVNGEFVLKESPFRGVLEKEAALSEQLTRFGLEAPDFQPCTEGGVIAEEKGRWFCLGRMPKGEALLASEIMKPEGIVLARDIGKAIGKLHLALQECDFPAEERNLTEEAGGWALQKLKKEGLMPLELCSRWEREFPEIYEKLPRQLVHRGLNPGNTLYHNGRVAGFHEFNLSTREARVFDPVCYATAVLSETWGKMDAAPWKNVLDAILKGYDEICPLTAEERKAVPWIILANQFVFMAWTGEREKLAQIAETNRQMTLWLWKILF
ncbi:MAG TPA: helix-turn-helix domain-containing protein [Candidatus Merdivicinus excrementipullorum]|uniref:Helix-turn-helix domain-containing protein n=1 Tax=Candidatus Merdivicinus excrementipullorum TaxID=2840867 RepID=A0A9D1FPL0_9FIRM|nr:helix-turn-helix domain-containing protein [Candidatus Merdivicinus excrementipullorum]